MSERPKVTQEMIDLYEEYTHVTLDRRDFMQKLARLAGSAAAASAIVPLIASNYAYAEVIAPTDARIKVEDVTFKSGAIDVKGYLARPANPTGKIGAVIVVHENRGLNAHTKDVARRFAVEGFLALAVDLLSRQGGTPPTDEEAAKMFQGVDQNAMASDAVAAIAYLKARPESTGKVGAVGFCFGGGIVNRMAIASPDLVAGVPYYGPVPPADLLAQAGKIKAKLMLHYAENDNFVNGRVPEYETALKTAGINYEKFVYAGAGHAFNNDTSEARYNKAAAELAWSRTIGFFKTNLSA